MHHVAGEHEWVDGECNHGPLVATETDKTILGKNSKALDAIRKVVIDKRFLNTLHHYVTFRYMYMNVFKNESLVFITNFISK